MTETTTPSTAPHRRWPLLVLGGVVLLAIGVAVVAATLGGRGPTASQPAPSDPSAPATVSSTAPTSADPLPVAVFLGDSYTQGFPPVPAEQRWSTLVAADAGWTEVNQGLGGTGFVTTSVMSACGLEYCPTYVERVPGVIAAAPDVVLIAGGQNDRAALAADPDRVRAAVDATYDQIRQGLPNARIIAVGPSTAEPATDLIVELDAWVQAAAARVGADYVSLIDPVVIEEDMIGPDRVHVNEAGYRAIADRVLTVALAD
ncbi:SGNH/GDSL hydrolase family protein [Cryobacterium arcticum]|uniref:SGNH hydrolase-type esterase domain-containing protein n=1 Tax=Cryobacterium arcticum TaxID=670052 RepID=A0A317ZUB1_9MICO|nr:SGNH/GDSL hydrolase family protein [Cryobacterium arcticum]PXA70036.1 hypothetical protein CTB96_08565 [Cryobacterium arcticum]